MSRHTCASTRSLRPRSATISIAAVAVFLLLWQVTPELGLVNGRFTSQPTLVLQAAWDVAFADDFLRHARISLTAFVVGYGLAMVVSIPLGIVLGTSRIARHMLEPPLMALYIAPTLILLPVMIVWLGIGIASKIAVAFLGAVFPIVVNTMAGMREADPRLVRMAQSFGASRFDVFTRILVPGALPSIVVGLRLAIGRAVLVVSSRVDVAHYFIDALHAPAEVARLRHARDTVVSEISTLKADLPKYEPSPGVIGNLALDSEFIMCLRGLGSTTHFQR
jgi:NitT/TauT family transport system permease protein